MNFEFFIAKRYLWSKRRHPFVGVVSTISVLGISVGVAALIIVLAVMNGFDEDLKSRIIGTRSHLVIEKEGSFTETGKVLRRLEGLEPVRGASAFIEGQALFQVGDWGSGVLVRGVDVEREKKSSRFYEYLVKGTLTQRPRQAVVGSELAKRARLDLGSQFLMATQNSEKPVSYTVEGIFSSGMYEYDANLVFMNLGAAAALFDTRGTVSGISVYLKKAERADEVKIKLHELLGPGFTVRTWAEMNRTLFSALKLEKIVMFLILALIILVACLNIAGSLTILVMDKTKDIGVLKALGATPAALRKIFAWDGLLLGLTGSLSGFLIGFSVCSLLKKYSWVELPKEIYYMDRLPVKMGFADTSAVLAVAVSLSALAAFYPAWMAGRLDPVKALRYE